MGLFFGALSIGNTNKKKQDFTHVHILFIHWIGVIFSCYAIFLSLFCSLRCVSLNFDFTFNLIGFRTEVLSFYALIYAFAMCCVYAHVRTVWYSIVKPFKLYYLIRQFYEHFSDEAKVFAFFVFVSLFKMVKLISPNKNRILRDNCVFRMRNQNVRTKNGILQVGSGFS